MTWMEDYLPNGQRRGPSALHVATSDVQNRTGAVASILLCMHDLGDGINDRVAKFVDAAKMN